MDENVVVAELLEVEELGSDKKLKKVVVKINEDGTKVNVVTNAPNVTSEKIGQSVIVALEGAEIPEKVHKTTIGGCISEGILCDSQMIKWKGGGAGTAVFVSDLPIGSTPPAQRPRPATSSSELPPPAEPGLFAKKPTKEEKKAIAKAQREARKEARSKKKKEDNGNDEENTVISSL